MRAVVFAYHNVGCRCLSTLLAHGVEIPLVVTHDDNPAEQIWFESVAALARLHDIAVARPSDPNAPEFVARVARLQPAFLFSFYYRQMLKPALLGIPTRGALNMHGSLLPRYRGRVPVNWAVIHGERQTGATLHYMVERPDAGDIVSQQAVPILPDDTALEVFGKVTVAAEMALHRVLPALLAGTAPRTPQELTQGSYYGGRRPEDGRIDWRRSAAEVHNLVRGVAPPYPGAFTEIEGKRVRVLRTTLPKESPSPVGFPALFCENGRCYAECGDGRAVRILSLEVDGKMLDSSSFERAGTTARQPLTSSSSQLCSSST
ncbi:MAG TPA: formyltransferase [Burkholderiales bacterium]|nr:formyltransferase [Burkholderiales bacterium]